jgi:sugar phosphate isomerase/epimerase
MKRLPVHLQLYSVAEDLEKDYFGVLEKVSEMGYDGVEFAGMFGGYSAKEIRGKADALGLEIISAHVNFDLLISDTEGAAAYHKALGCRYIVIPWIDAACLPGGEKWTEFRANILKVAEKLKAYDMQLLYHNHNFEFGKVNGKYILDEFYDSIPADTLKVQLDTCWVTVGNEDAVAYIEKYAGRLPIVHLKDFTADRPAAVDERLFALIGDAGGDGSEKKQDLNFDFRPVGHGKMNFPPIIDAAKKAGVGHVVVEQDRSTGRPALEAAKMSIEYLRSIGV